jgi:hypothetical protein
MFSETKSREILRFEGKQNELFPEGTELSVLLYAGCPKKPENY